MKIKLSSKLVETKERQKLRNKPNGVNIIGLALGKKITIEQELTNVKYLIDSPTLRHDLFLKNCVPFTEGSV